MSKRSTRTSPDAPPVSPLLLPAEFAKWKAEQAAQEADGEWSAVPVDSDGITDGTGIPEADLDRMIDATAEAEEFDRKAETIVAAMQKHNASTVGELFDILRKKREADALAAADLDGEGGAR